VPPEPLSLGRAKTAPAAMVPLTTYVVKVASRCNLNCSYCYMYNLQDRTYRDQPPSMPDEVRDCLITRIRSHAARHGFGRVHLILHGGEPLLFGKARLAAWVSAVRAGLAPAVEPFFSMQSNGVLIDDEWVDLLADLGVRIGISVDGPREIHDRHRLDRRGRGSFDQVIAAIRLLQRHPRGPEVFSTVMAVVDTTIPPADVFETWQFLDVPGFDLSMPHANYEHPPPVGSLSYGEWLVEFFDLWWRQNRPDRHVRYFENMLRMYFGFPFSTDNIGGKPVDVVVIETDGSIEPTDAFKSCFDGATKLGLNVLDNELDDVADSPLVQVFQRGAEGLCAGCQACHLRDVCGGGYMPHRYSSVNGFDNPSVYCADLMYLLEHMHGRIVEALRDSGLEKEFPS
jgi:uncharacterized protein